MQPRGSGRPTHRTEHYCGVHVFVKGAQCSNVDLRGSAWRLSRDLGRRTTGPAPSTTRSSSHLEAGRDGTSQGSRASRRWGRHVLVSICP